MKLVEEEKAEEAMEQEVTMQTLSLWPGEAQYGERLKETTGEWSR